MKTPIQLFGMMLSGKSRKEIVEAMSDEQKVFLKERAESIPHNRQQRRKLERTGIKLKKKNRLNQENDCPGNK